MRRLALLCSFVAVLVLGAPLVAPVATMAQAGSPMSATLFTNRIQWQAAAGTTVNAVLRDATGIKARGTAQANASGVATIMLQPARGGGGMGGGGGNNQYIRPANIISLTLASGPATVVTVPNLLAELDSAADKVVGTAPANGAVDVTVTYGPNPTDMITQKATADATGAFTVDLTGKVDVKPGVSGSATFTTAEGHSFTAQFAVLEAEFSVGSRNVGGRATLGTTVQAALTSAGGQAKGTRSLEVLGSMDWNMVGGGGGGGGGGGANALQPVAIGDTAKVTRTGGAIAAPLVLQLVVPRLDVEVDRTTGRVTGVAPANTNLIVRAVAPDGTTETKKVTTDANGAFSVQLTSVLTPGWSVYVTYDPGTGIRSRSLFILPQIRVRVYGSSVAGIAQPGVPVTVTVRTSDGALVGQANTNANNNGDFNTNIVANNQPISIDPGDLVDVDLTAGDPVSLLVPKITSLTDASTDAVSGEAPAGGALHVTAGQGMNAVALDIKADNTGHYKADFAGKFDIVAPANGNITLTQSNGHQFLMGWAAVQLTMTIDGPNVVGNGAPGRRVSVVYKTPAGATAATASARVADVGGGGGGFGGNVDWTGTLRDNTSQLVNVRSGDTLNVTVGDDVINYVVPKLAGVALIGDNTVNGVTEVGAPLRLTVTGTGGGGGPGGGMPPVTADVTADDQGLFSHDFTAAHDLIYNDSIQVRLVWGGNIVFRTIRTPGLRVDLNAGTVYGSIEPNVQVTVRLVSPSGTERAKVVVKSGDDATFVAPLRLPNGDPIVPAKDDQIFVTAPDAKDTKEVTMTVPELTIKADKTANTVTGTATPGGSLVVQVGATFFRFGPGNFGQSRPQIAADGTWTANFGGRLTVQPGQQFTSVYRLAVGHIVNYAVNVPIVNVQIGGGRVCGVGPERVDVSSDLSGGTGPAGSGKDRSANDGSFEIRLTDTQGAEVASGTGQLVRTKVAADTLDVTVPDLTAQVDWSTGRITGMGPANTQIQVIAPIRGCLGNRDLNGGGFNFNAVQTNATGQFNAQVAQRTPGAGFELAFFTADGQRVYRHVYRTLGQIYVRTDKVGGKATPLAPVAIVLQTAAGVERARVNVVAMSDGTFMGMVKDTSGQSVTINAGDVVKIDSGGESVSVPVEDLTFDFDPVNGLVGNAPANRALRIEMVLADGRVLTNNATSDDHGRFAYKASDIPPLANWSFADIRVIRAVLPTANGHEIISEMTLGSTGPTPTPTPSTGKAIKIFLPYGEKPRR